MNTQNIPYKNHTFQNLPYKDGSYLSSRVSSQVPGRMNIIFPFTMFYKIQLEEGVLRAAFSPGSMDTFLWPNNDDMHQHDHYELLYVLEGELTNQIENISYHYKKGDACLLNRNTRHADIPKSGYSVVFLNFSAEFIEDLLGNDIVFRGDGRIIRPDGKIHQFLTSNLRGEDGFARNYLEFSPSGRPYGQQSALDAWNLIDQIQQELVSQKPGTLYLVKGLLLRLFGCLEDESGYYSNFIHLDTGRQDYLFARISNYLKENAGNVSREELSKSLNYNAEYLNQIVKKRTGQSLMQLARVYRLERAKQLLDDTSISVSSIIKELGFVSSSHFYSFFRHETGMSPQQYRSR